ncbi:MAG TPA: hypothetical protein VM580_23170 [Labilithrix sp.]|nr:hypothetical protein [Labilithrix sp.]
MDAKLATAFAIAAAASTTTCGGLTGADSLTDERSEEGLLETTAGLTVDADDVNGPFGPPEPPFDPASGQKPPDGEESRYAVPFAGWCVARVQKVWDPARGREIEVLITDCR